MGRPTKIANLFKPAATSKKNPTPLGSAGFDNARENIDPHIKTQVVSSREGSIEKVPVNGNDITNKTYVDAQFPVTHASTTGQTTDDHHNEVHTIVSHDTTGTGANVTTLTDNSMADTLHRHSELSASDGTPDRALVVDSTGEVGIGTTTPAAPLHVYADTSTLAKFERHTSTDGFTLITVDAGDPQINFNQGGGIVWGLGLDDGDADKFKIATGTIVAGTAALTIERGGNVGIGTTSPGFKLDVRGDTWIQGGRLFLKSPSGESRFYLTGSDDDAGDGIMYIYDDTETLGIKLNAGDVSYFTGGNVGIGTTSPDRLLHLRDDTVTATLEIEGGDTQDARLMLTADKFDDSADLYQIIHTASDNDIEFQRWLGASYRSDMVIDSTGNVGIGTTSPGNQLDIRNAISGTKLDIMQSSVGSGDTTGIHFGVTTGSTGKKGAIFFERTTTNARGSFHIAVDSINDANPAVLADSKFTIDYLGNVGIGTTSPGTPLTVQGTDGSNAISLLNTAGTAVAYMWSDASAAGVLSLQNSSGVTGVKFEVDGDHSYILNGNVGIGTTSPASPLHIDQSSTTAAIPVVTIDQADVSEEMIEFKTTIGAGNAIEAVGAKALTTTHFIKVTLPGGLTRYIPCGTIA